MYAGPSKTSNVAQLRGADMMRPGVQSESNFLTLIRSAASLGVSVLLLTSITSSLFGKRRNCACIGRT